MASASLVGAQTLQTLCSFNNTNGADPTAALTLGNDGNFYGTTYLGGITNHTYANGMGTVFKVTTGGTLTTLYSFSGSTNDGMFPYAGLTLGTNGDLYGTTSGSSFSFPGTVFKVATNGTLTMLVLQDDSLGVNPRNAGLTVGNDGNFYGTTEYGQIGNGKMFELTTNGQYTELVSFNGQCQSPYAYLPVAALTLGKDGNFYGTTLYGGCSGYGSVFKATTNGTLTSLHLFYGGDGEDPTAALALGDDGNFYGTTPAGGSTYTGGLSGYGTVFKMATNGTLTTLVNFQGTNGASPYSALVLGNDGNFYGTTYGGGIANSTYTNGMGTIFRITTNGTLTSLVSFNFTNGANPYAGLTPCNDGNFYGTTCYGGDNNQGTVFRLLLPPVITVQPQSQTNNAGATATFTASATSLNPLSYQWQKNSTNLVDGGNISGSTTNILTITGISDSDAANYSVIVSNANFSVTSSNATLTVIDPPIIMAQPTNMLVLPGTNVAFGVSLNGTTAFLYQWRFNGTNLLNATNAIYTISSVGTNNAGNYSVVVTNAADSAISSNAALVVVLSPTSQTNYASSTATFTATAFSPESLNYQWQKNGTNLINGGNLSGATNSTLTIPNVSDADAAIYDLVVSDATGSVTTSNAVLTVNDLPFVNTQPQSQTVLVGSDVTFSAAAYGAPPLVFQWYFKGTPIGSPVGGTNYSSYTLTDVGTNQAGNYWVQVVNGHGSLTSSNAALTVVALPPTITAQPTNLMNKAGSAATFSVVAAGSSPLTFQWQKNGTNLVNGGNLSGATDNTLTIASVSDNDAAIYSVTVTNLAGGTTSSNATLTVIDPPVITAQPLGQRITLGGYVSFNVSVSNPPPLYYQWRFNSANLLNATNAAYAIQAVAATNTGNYSVVVTNLAGSATSSNALLTVLVPPALALQLWAGYPLLSLDGMLSNNFVVQYSTNLAGTNWIVLLSLTNLSANPYMFLDPAGVDQPARFYRAFMQ